MLYHSNDFSFSSHCVFSLLIMYGDFFLDGWIWCTRQLNSYKLVFSNVVLLIVGRGEVFYIFMIMPQYFSKHNASALCFSQVFLRVFVCPLKCKKMARVSWSWVFPFPQGSESPITPQPDIIWLIRCSWGQALSRSIECSEGCLGGTVCWAPDSCFLLRSWYQACGMCPASG